MVDPQVTMGFNTTMVVHDLDDFGVPFFSSPLDRVTGNNSCRLSLRIYTLVKFTVDAAGIHVMS